VHFSIKMVDASLDGRIEKANKYVYPGQDKSWINCKWGQIEKVGAGACAASALCGAGALLSSSDSDPGQDASTGMEDSLLGKRLADEAGFAQGGKDANVPCCSAASSASSQADALRAAGLKYV